MPDAPRPPRAKRAVPTATVVAARRRVAPVPRVLPDPVPSTRPGFRVPSPIIDVEEEDEDETSNHDSGTNYALRLTEALEAISSAQGSVSIPRGGATPPREPPSPVPASPVPPARAGPSTPSTLARLGSGFNSLPPIRLPIGPPIPWRLGLPALVVLLVVTVLVARPMAQGDSQVSRLPSMPTPETYPVQQEAPLFTDAQPTAAPAPAAPLGVPDSGGVGFDVLDVGLKLIAVLALAYGSLLLLKRAGMGGAAAVKIGSRTSGMQVVASLTLAPNRTVHLLKVPGGKTVLVGATPNQVNLIVDLGDLADDPESEASGSFFDILKGKLPQ